MICNNKKIYLHYIWQQNMVIHFYYMRYVRHALLNMLSFNAKSDLYMCMKSESIETKSIDEKTYNKKKHCACVSALHEHKEMCTHANDLEWGLMLVEIKAYSLCLNIAIKLLLKHRGLNKMAAILQTTFWNAFVKKCFIFNIIALNWVIGIQMTKKLSLISGPFY